MQEEPVMYPISVNNKQGPVILISRQIEYTFPMGYAYLAGYLREHGEPVEVMFRPRKITEQFVDEVLAKKPILIAFGGLFGEMEEIRNWIKLFHAKNRGRVPIVIGGHMVSPTPELAMRKLGADFGVIGEGEIILYELVRAIRDGADVTKIGGLIVRTDNGLVSTGKGTIIEDLSQIPKIPFDLFPVQDWLPIGEWYASHYSNAHWHYGDWVIPVHGGRGCPYACNFCYHHSRARYRPMPDMIAESKEALEKYSGNFLYFGDDLVIGNQKRANLLVDELEKNNIHIPYSISIRFDILKRLDEATLLRLKESGCRIMGLGIESGSDRILKIIGKNCTAEDILTQLKRLKDGGILPAVSVMVGQYTETREDVEMTISLMCQSIKDNPLINYNVSICTPFPGSELYAKIFEDGLLKTEEEYYERFFFGKHRIGDWNQVVNLSSMTDEEVIEMYKRAWAEYRKAKRKELGYESQMFGLMCIAINKAFPFLPKPWLLALDKKRLRYFGVME